MTGASRGIGRAICFRLARDGYDIIALARNEAELESLGIEVSQLGGKCRVIALDLTHNAAIAAALYGVEVDVLVNNAGLGVTKPFTELSPDEWHKMIDLNVNALFHVTRAVLPGMLLRGSGTRVYDRIDRRPVRVRRRVLLRGDEGVRELVGGVADARSAGPRGEGVGGDARWRGDGVRRQDADCRGRLEALGGGCRGRRELRDRHAGQGVGASGGGSHFERSSGAVRMTGGQEDR